MVFFQKDYDNIEKYAEESSLTISEFIREAIRYKIRSIENPEYYNQIVKTVKNGQTKAEAKAEQREKLRLEGINSMYGSMNEIKEMANKILKTKRKVITESDLNLVISSLGKKEANINELHEKTNIPNETLISMLKDRTQFSVKMNGKYKLKQVNKKL